MENNIKQTHEFNQFEKIILGLIDNNYGCCDDFISKDTSIGLRNNLNRLNKSGEMHQAGIGNKDDHQKNKSIRGDKIKWMTDNSVDEFEAIVQKKIGNFIEHLNTTCFTSINQFESHYASYERESFYKRHLDQFKNDDQRKYSLILYLNEDWTDEDGGILSLYPKDAAQIDIAPMEGRMVFFRSDEMEHEVHPSLTRSRISIAGWLKSSPIS